MLSDVIALGGGLVLLVAASDWLVDGAVGLARRFGVSMLVVGLTVVAYGTSFPEFVVSTLAAVRGVADFAVGNVVGSNIANIGLVLGIAALIKPFAVGGGTLFRRDMPFLMLCTVSAVLAFLNGSVARWEGVALLTLAVVFTVLCLKYAGGDEAISEGAEPIAEQSPMTPAVLRLLLGGVGLFFGAHFMVDGGSAIAKSFGISERVIGLTVVAIGTSLPELAASVAGAMKGYPELAVGNVVGSCLFNLSFVIGSAAIIQPLDVTIGAMVWDLAVMGGLTVVMWLMFFTGRRVSRAEGVGLVSIYTAFMAWIVISTAAAM